MFPCKALEIIEAIRRGNTCVICIFRYFSQTDVKIFMLEKVDEERERERERGRGKREREKEKRRERREKEQDEKGERRRGKERKEKNWRKNISSSTYREPTNNHFEVMIHRFVSFILIK